MLISDKGFSFLDPIRYGVYDSDTRLAVEIWQKRNKKLITTIGNLTENEFNKELGSVGYATWKAILRTIEANPYEGIVPEFFDVGQEMIDPLTPLPDPALADQTADATHYVKTEISVSRLALRDQPSFIKVSKNAAEDNDNKGNLIEMLDNNTLLKVTEPNIGYACEWHQVQVVDPKKDFDSLRNQTFYVYAEFTRPLSRTPELLPVKYNECESKAFIKKNKFDLDWTNIDTCESFFDEATCAYYTVVELEDLKTSNSMINRQKKSAIQTGVRNLLEYYDKKREEEYITRLLNAFRFAEVPDNGWYLDKRPGSRIKFLVKIPAKYFDALSQQLDSLLDTAIAGASLPENWKTVSLTMAEINEDIEIVASRLLEYQQDIEKWGGYIPNFDLKDEVEKIKIFPSMINEFLKANGYETTGNEENLIEIGFEGPSFDVRYILYNEGASSVPLRIGFNCLKKREPFNSDRSMGYIFYLDEMVRDINQAKRPWIEFLQSYTFPVLEINPSKKQSPLVKEDSNISKQFNKLAEVTGCDEAIRSLKQKLEEDLILQEPYFKNRLAEINLKRMDFVGDNLLSCENIPRLIRGIENLADAYNNILNKVDIGDLASLVSSCIGLSASDIESSICEVIFESLGLDKLDSLIANLNPAQAASIGLEVTTQMEQFALRTNANFSELEVKRAAIRNVVTPEELCGLVRTFSIGFNCEELLFKLPKIPTINIPDNLWTVDIMANLGEAIYNAIVSALSSALISIIKEIFGMLCSICTSKNDNFGDSNIKDFFNSRDNPSFQNVQKQAFKDLGIPSADMQDTISNFFNDLSAILTPAEICALLDGAPSTEILKIIKRLLHSKYPILENYLSSDKKIKSLFSYLGNFIDPKICENILSNKNKIVPDKICLERTEIKRNLLEDKMSPEQIEQQLQQTKDRQIEQFKRLAKVANGDIFKDVLNKKCGGRGITQPSHPSFDYLNNKLINTIFDNVHSAFHLDMENFVISLIERQRENANQNYDQQVFKKAESAKLILRGTESGGTKPSDFGQQQINDILQDPVGDGGISTKPINDIATEVKDILANGENVTLQIVENKQIYVYKVQLQNILDTIQKLQNSAFNDNIAKQSAITDLLNKVSSTEPTYDNIVKLLQGVKDSENYYVNQIKDAESIKKKIKAYNDAKAKFDKSKNLANALALAKLKDSANLKETCVEFPNFNSIINEIKDFAEKNISIMQNIIEYSVEPYDGKTKTKNKYSAKINSPYFEEPIIIEEEEQNDDKVQSLIDHYGLPTGKSKNDYSAQQEIFNSFIKDRLGKIVNANLLNNETFSGFIKSEIFSKITQTLIANINTTISNSPLFKRSELEKIDFTFDSNRPAHCPPPSEESGELLNIEQIKRKVLESYNKKIASCKNKEVSVEQGTSREFEEANLGGVIIATIQVYIIEALLKGMFSFSEFKLSDMVKGDVLTRFIIEYIKEEITEEGQEFAQKFLIQVRDYTDSLGNIFPSSGEDVKSTPNKELIEKTSPNYYSGVAALEFHIKNEMKNISPAMETVLGTRVVDINKSLMQLIPQSSDLSTNTGFTDIIDSIKNANGILATAKINNGGTFFLEKYVRTCIQDKQTIVSHVNSTSDLSYGVRLVYIVPPDLKNSSGKGFQDLVYHTANINEPILKSWDFETEKAFNLADRDVVRMQFEFIRPITPPAAKAPESTIFTIPLITVEETTKRKARVQNVVEEDKIYSDLKDQLMNSDEWKLLFDYCFPMKRLLSLNTIYTMVTTSVVLSELEDIFLNTKRELRMLHNLLVMPEQPEQWWKKNIPGITDAGGNVGIRNTRMGNVTTKGTTPNLVKMAAMTIPMMIKGMAEIFDPSYKLIKALDDQGAAIGGLTWGTVPQVLPVTIFGPPPLGIGIGPPLLFYGMAALSMPLLSGERKKKQLRDLNYDLETMTDDEIKTLKEKDCKK